MPPAAPREFRAAWVATVANIDWPSRPGLTTPQQQAEAIAILDCARTLKLNAIILQVRPATDALYASTIEPWSEYLTGKQGVAPAPYYDPLAFWVSEAHRRSLELHAWFNPYRARQTGAKSALAANHISKTHPEIVKSYGDLLWMDPGEPLAAKRTLQVISEVVRNYDVDGVHVDDYFYPYPIPLPGAKPPVQKPPALDSLKPSPPVPIPELDFPDEPSWRRYLAAGGKLSRADWRRNNVDRLVEDIGRTVHAIKPWVRFGVSPFGIGRIDKRPKGIEGFSQYDKLYADVEQWWQRGWMDYLAPQLYWTIAKPQQSFPVLLEYWSHLNQADRHLWPGLFTSRINDTSQTWQSEEITAQINALRQHRGSDGHIHFSMVALLQNRRGISDLLAAGPYLQPALVPATPWLDAVGPNAPSLESTDPAGSGVAPSLAVSPGTGKPVWLYAVWKKQLNRWSFSVLNASNRTIDLTTDPLLGAVEKVVVSAIDSVGNESPRVSFTPKSKAPR